MNRSDVPLILINTTDLGYGVRFSFVQEYFDLLCSELSSFPVARAVTASSAVPLIFNPVIVENFHDCKTKFPDWYLAAKKRTANNIELNQVITGLESYYKKDKRQYAHFVDGGITDNLGLRAIFEVLEIAGGFKAYLQELSFQPPKHLVIISVDASTQPQIENSSKEPSVEETINAITDIQIHRYNTATIEILSQSLQ